VVCGDCGTRTLSCLDDCTWDAGGVCTDEGECTPGERVTTSDGCPDGERRELECSDSCELVEVEDCAGEACATPGEVETVPCGECGTTERFCTASRYWVYSECVEGGECSPGTSSEIECGRCGRQSVRCTETCEWSTLGGCVDEGECDPGETFRTADGCVAGESRLLECDDSCSYFEVEPCEAGVPGSGDSLRVELDWDTMGIGFGDTDLDLHLHNGGSTTDFFTGDDCYYANCTASAWSDVDWGLAPTMDVTACSSAPRGAGARWEDLGYCRNPRLETDLISCDPAVTDRDSSRFCAPEVIVIDNPPDGSQYRILVNYYSDHGLVGPTHPTVRIYCGGTLEATYGEGDVGLETRGGSGSTSESWIVADVGFIADAFGGMSCVVNQITTAIGEPWIQRTSAFGPPWSPM
jgi:hypothetical protein